jgi:hypothetical protein
MRNEKVGTAMPGIEPGTLFHTRWICDSSLRGEVSHFYDILIFFKEHFCDLIRIRTEIPSRAVWL